MDEEKVATQTDEELDLNIGDNDEDTGFDSEAQTDESDDDSDDSDKSEEQTDDDAGEQDGDDKESYESEEDFLAQFKLPGDPKTLEDVISSYQKLLGQFNTSRQGDAEARKLDETRKTLEQNTQKRDSYFNRSPFGAYMKTLEESGAVDPDTLQSNKQWASTMDKVLDPFFRQVEEAFDALTGLAVKLRDQQRNASWNRIPPNQRNLVKREDLEPIMDQMGLLDYGEALRFKAVSDPHLLSEFAKQERQKGAQQQKKKGKLARFSAQRRGAPTDSGGEIFSKFLNRDGSLDEDKLSRLKDPTGKVRQRVVDAYLAKFK